MNIFWNSVNPIDVTDFNRVIGDLEVASFDTLGECAARYVLGLPLNVLETLTAAKLSQHFEGGVRGFGNMDNVNYSETEFGKHFKNAISAVITEGVASKGILRTTTKGVHMPFYKWSEYAAILIGRIASRWLLNYIQAKLPQTVIDAMEKSQKHAVFMQEVNQSK